MNKVVRCDGKEFEYEGCLGCEIVKGNLPSFGDVVYEDEEFFFVLVFELPINGFIVISTKRCISSINEMTENERVNLIKLINKLLIKLKELNICSHFNIVQQEKEGYHFHIWLMPAHNWMKEKFGKTLKNLKSIFDYALANFRDKEHLDEISNTTKMLKEEMKKTV